MFFKKKKVLDFREYTPKSCLKVPQNVKQKKYDIIDSHIHLGPRYKSENFLQRYNIDDFVKMLKENGVSHAVDLELFSEEHFNKVLEITKEYNDFFSFCAPINLNGFEDSAFSENIYNYMINIAKGENICGFKVWKNLGLTLKRQNGKLARIDDSEFDIIWKSAAFLKLPVVIHVADPISFFYPADRYNERLEELLTYPMWNYSERGLSHTDIIEQFENVLKNNPNTTFIAAHIINCASDLGRAEELMDKYPNLNVDIAAVLSEIGRQPRAFAKFAKKYQNRILFGTDAFGGDALNYAQYKRFLETDDEYFEYSSSQNLSQGKWRIYGCDLSEDILAKIYYANAKAIFNIK